MGSSSRAVFSPIRIKVAKSMQGMAGMSFIKFPLLLHTFKKRTEWEGLILIGSINYHLVLKNKKKES